MIRATTLALVFVSTASVASAQQAGTTVLADQAAGMCQAAAEQKCACYQPVATFQPNGAKLEVSATEVRVSRGASASELTAESSALAIGDTVTTGETGAALVTFPSGCQLNLQKQSLVTISQVEDCACAIPVQADGSFGAQAGEGGGIGGPEIFAGITFGVIGAGAIIEATSGSDGNKCDPNVVSPPCPSSVP